MIFSVSFVNASDTSTNDLDTNESMILSTVPEENILAENTEIISNGDSSSIGQTDESQNTGETENNENALILRASNDEFLADETQILRAGNDETQSLSGDDNPILSAPVRGPNDRDLTGGTMDDVKREFLDIAEHGGGGTLYLNGGTYTGGASIMAGNNPSAGDPWWRDGEAREDQLYFNNIKIYGGSELGDGVMAQFGDSWDYALVFGIANSKSPVIPGSDDKRGYYSTYGCFLNNVSFENLNATTKLVNFLGGSLTDCTINNCISKYQFMGMEGNYWDCKSLPVINCNFTNCHQTYPGEDLVKDGSGQLGAVFGVNMTNCNFINTTSAQHGGALCIADESNWGSTRVPSVLTNCSFINITSRWFAIYIHGHFKTSYGYIVSPEIIDGCHFINCTGTGEYSGAIGISHDDLIIKNSEFVNCTGGQGGAIMVGGIDRWHDGFSGNNTKGNNVTIENCNFTNNVVTIDRPGSYCIGIDKWDNNKPKDYSQYRYYTRNGDNDYTYTPDGSGDYYNKHEPLTFNATGNAGAIYVVGNDTKIINCIFDENKAESGNGSAIYILGQRAVINDTQFYNHEAISGTVFIKGNNATINNSTFIKNIADEGAGVYIEGNNTAINGSAFEDNKVWFDGAGVYILGTNTKIIDSNFTDNFAYFSGAGVYIKGSNTNITGSNFTDNNASFGAGVRIEGNNTVIHYSNFTCNDATDGGGVYIEGDYTDINSNGFYNNTAVKGAGIYVEGRNTTVNDTQFDYNNVTHQGGAAFVDGSNTIFSNNNFTYNNAIPQDKNEYSGLGGAIFVTGNNTLTLSNDYEHNTARNGSAIYSSGNNLTVINEIFRENQAWSYVLLTVAEPEKSLYNTEDVEIEIVHFGGDNMVNAIHNNASNTEIRLKNVTYVNSYGKERHTNENEFEYPVDGVENSEQGTKLYQDDREYHQLIHVNVTDEAGNVIYNNTNITTNLYGDIYVTLPKSKLKVGTYTVNALHPEDWNYKKIKNSAIFVILRHVDLSVEKTSDKTEYFDDDIAKWTITVKNAANGTNATNVVLDDILPSDFEFINCTTENGTYDEHTGLWTIGFMGNGTEATLVIYALVESDIERMNNIVHIDCEEKNADISVDRVVTPNKDSFVEGEIANWTIIVKNNGAHAVHDVSLNHVFPFEFEVEPHTTPETSAGTYDDVNNRTWTIGELAPNTEVTLKIISRATNNVTTITNLMSLDYREKHLNLTVNKTSDQEEYHDGEDATITITVHNGEGCNATGVVLKDILQPEFEYDSHVGSGYDPQTNIWNIGNMTQNSEAKLVIKATAKRIYGNVTNVAVVTSDETDWDEDNNEANRTVKVSPLPTPIKTVNNITPNYHGEIEYNLTINNTGTIKYTNNLTVIDTLPEGLEFVHLVDLTGARSLGFKQEGNKLTWNLTDIDYTAPAIITIKVRVVGIGELITNKTFIDNVTGRNDIKYIGNLTNNLTLIGPNGTTEKTNCTVYPVPIIDLSVEIVSDKNEYFVDDVATWTITVHNAGNGTNATYVNLTDLFNGDFHDNFVIIGWTTKNG
ncbi:MAG: DUF11 domain-containing protein, partial [Methanobrevibacter sp.]|nr:DUF11 domain-containing protein [Methanobrevibacter sp.]